MLGYCNNPEPKSLPFPGILCFIYRGEAVPSPINNMYVQVDENVDHL